ncbi:MAG: 4Fe-4S dicluster-binding protein [Acidobacteriota bacterium]
MPAPADYKNKFLKKPPKRLAVIDHTNCSGCAGSPACVAFCETVTVKTQVVDAIRYIASPQAPNNLAVVEYDRCIGCALCSEVCPWDAITMYSFEEAWDAHAQVTLVEYSPEIDVHPRPREEETETKPAAAAPGPAP